MELLIVHVPIVRVKEPKHVVHVLEGLTLMVKDATFVTALADKGKILRLVRRHFLSRKGHQFDPCFFFSQSPFVNINYCLAGDEPGTNYLSTRYIVILIYS